MMTLTLLARLQLSESSNVRGRLFGEAAERIQELEEKLAKETARFEWWLSPNLHLSNHPEILGQIIAGAKELWTLDQWREFIDKKIEGEPWVCNYMERNFPDTHRAMKESTEEET